LLLVYQIFISNHERLTNKQQISVPGDLPLDHTQQLQSGCNVMTVHACKLTHFLNWQLASAMFIQVFQHHWFPICMIRYSAKIRQWFLWCTWLTLLLW